MNIIDEVYHDLKNTLLKRSFNPPRDKFELYKDILIGLYKHPPEESEIINYKLRKNGNKRK
mgnify:CR=1 FL=1|jgi:hypothetical protein